jgi:hypothetical protein
MADESNASLNEVVALLRRQVEQADTSAKRAEEAAAEERQRRLKKDSQRVRVSRLLALFLVTLVGVWGLGGVNRYTLRSLTDAVPAEYLQKQIDMHQKFSYASNFAALLVVGGLYFAILDFVAFTLRRFFLSDK